MDESARLSDHLEAVAKLMELDAENPYKVRAYLSASLQVRGRTFQELQDPLSIRGIGPSIGTTIKEFLLRGTSTRMETLSSRWPVEILSLMRVQGVGPRTAVALFNQGISSFEELVEKAKSGALSAKLTERVLTAESHNNRIPIEMALSQAEMVFAALKSAGARRVEVGGSVRRHSPTCKDIDIIAEATEETSEEIRRSFERQGKVLWSGPSKSSILIVGSRPIQCDLWLVQTWHWGSALNYVTGSKAHNVRLRGMLKSRGMRLNEYGIYAPLDGIDLDQRKVLYGPEGATSSGELVARRVGGTNEEDVYSLLGMSYVLPSQRSE